MPRFDEFQVVTHLNMLDRSLTIAIQKLMCTSWSLNITVNPFLGKRLEATMCYLPKLLNCVWKHSIDFFSDADTSRNLLIDLSKRSKDHFDIIFFSRDRFNCIIVNICHYKNATISPWLDDGNIFQQISHLSCFFRSRHGCLPVKQGAQLPVSIPMQGLQCAQIPVPRQL